MLEGIKAVIFDLDGTLADSMWVWTRVDELFITEYHLVEPDDLHEKLEGKSFTETAELFLEVFPQLTMTVPEIKHIWYEMAVDQYQKEVQMKKSAVKFLQYLKENGYGIGLATSNDRDLVDRFFEVQGLDKLVDVICTGCEVKKGKPSPDVYLHTAKSLGVTPEECLVFEDVPMGILAGKNAGMKVCAVQDAFSDCQIKRKKELADYYINSFDDIFDKTYEVL